MEHRLGKRIEVDSDLFRLIPFCADAINKFRVGADGRTAYERITAHKFKGFDVGFGKVVDYSFETDTHHRQTKQIQEEAPSYSEGTPVDLRHIL